MTLAVTAKAKEMQAQGKSIISFGAGEPDFNTPAHIRQKAKEYLDQDVSTYTAVQGLPKVRKVFAEELSKAHDTSIDPDDVLVSCGAKHSLYNLFMATLEPGDEFIVPAPYWVSYTSMIELCGAKAVSIKTTEANDFLMEMSDLESAITSKTKGILINSPSNPTGSIYSEEQLKEIGALCQKHGLFVVCDDIYRNLVYGESNWTSFLKTNPTLKDQTILIDGVSKTYAMTGWRVGYAAGPKQVIKAMAKLQGQSTSNANHLAQYAAMEAVDGSQECIKDMKSEFATRRKALHEGLCGIKDVTCNLPQGAFYAFPNLNAYLGKTSADGHKIVDDVSFASYLVEHAGVAIVPGSAFGDPGFARLSFACSMEDILEGVKRLKTSLESFS